MDVKKILKVLFIAVVVPGGSLVLGYHGAKYGKQLYDKWKQKREDTTEQSETKN